MSPSVAQQHPDNQFSIQKRAGHFDKKYNCGDAAKRYPLVVSPTFLINNIKVVIPFSGRDLISHARQPRPAIPQIE
jgi:hypothetical protein